jgi:hypothetical protein
MFVLVKFDEDELVMVIMMMMQLVREEGSLESEYLFWLMCLAENEN